MFLINMYCSSRIDISSKGFSEVIDITRPTEAVLRKSGLRNGLLTAFVSGSTASITTIEYEEGAIEDLKKAIERIAPSAIHYEHDRRWGDGNGFSHVRAALLKASLTVPFEDGRLLLGTWQQIVFIDFDNRPRQRSIIVGIVGD